MKGCRVRTQFEICGCTLSVAVYPQLNWAFASFVDFACHASETNTQHNGFCFKFLQRFCNNFFCILPFGCKFRRRLCRFFRFYKTKNQPECFLTDFCFLVAEREGFEPPEPRSSTVFKTAAIDHSAISPGAKVEHFFLPTKFFTSFFSKIFIKCGQKAHNQQKD